MSEDINKIFRDDVREKKRTARGVHGLASKRGLVGKVYTPGDLLDGQTLEGKRYRGTGKVEKWNMYKEVLPLKEFEKLPIEKQR